MLRKIIVPIFRELHRDCPEDLRPKWNSLDGCWDYPNGAQLHLAAANDGHADDSRGQRAHLCVVDEAGFVDDLDYLVNSVLLPQTLTTGGRIVLISTPPLTPAHAFYGFSVRAEERGAYIVRTLNDNTHISDQAKAELIEQMGGIDSTEAQREAFCRFVVDSSRAIIPEYDDAADAACVRETKPPTYEMPLVAMDPAFEDGHAIGFGYYDFRRAKLVFQAEALLHRQTTDKVAEVIRATEDRLWKGRNLRTPVRWSDTDLRLIEDLTELHKIPFQPTAKDDKEAQVNALRMLVKRRGIEIDPSCVALRRQLKLGIWNKQRTQFERTKEDGHFDMVDMAIYLLRNAPVYENPYPALPEGVTYATHHIRVRPDQRSETGRAVQGMFGRRN